MTHPPVTRVFHLTHLFSPVPRGLWIPQVVPIPKKPVGLQTPLVRQTEATAETLVMPLPTTVTGPSPASPRANSTAILQTVSEALYILPHPSPSTQTPAETLDYPPNSVRTPVSPLLPNRLRPPLAQTPTLRISVSVTTCWAWVFPE